MKKSEACTIDLCLARLDVEHTRCEHYVSLLSDDERRRAERYHFDADRRRFVTGRGVLRTLLGSRLNCRPEALRFGYGANAKPALAGHATGLQFNLSRSGDWALLALTFGAEIGVDLEQIRGGFVESTIPEQFFSERECARLRELPESAQPLAFFQCWTRKEAFVKAIGRGLPYGLDEFDVSLDPDSPPALLAIHNDEAEAARWSLFSLAPTLGLVAAVAVRGHGYELNFQTHAHL